MSEYVITDNGELCHYGVKGMRWGVRKNTKLLKSGDNAKREKAAAALEKHRKKGAAKVEKLKKKGVKLEKSHEQKIIKSETKAAKLNRKAAGKRRAAYRFYVSESRASKLVGEAHFLEIKANNLIAKSNEAKAKINKNNAMISAFERELANIDKALVDRGKNYLKDD